MQQRRAVALWSGGKDSTLALEAALADASLHMAGLVTTVTEEYDRISMHGVRRALLEAQASSLALPLHIAAIHQGCTNAGYEESVARVLAPLVESGVTHVVCGDLYLADIRAYRERQLSALGLQALFPLWLRDTTALAHDFIQRGYTATLCCVDPVQIAPHLVGRAYDLALLDDLPPTADPCGENGEFHTFVHGGPIYRSAIQISVGDRVNRDGFWFCDLLLAAT